MSYANFDLEDFLKNESFKQWVYQPTRIPMHFGSVSEKQHPEMRQN
jgi:hypothetical protein